jgi:peptide deformylase
MPTLNILKYPDPRLRAVCEPVTAFDDGLSLLAADMIETMLAAPGAGLAAPQVGIPRRLIVIDNRDDREAEEYGSNNLVLANPVIVASEGRQSEKEGCLSVEGLSAGVNRFDLVLVDYQDLQGRPQRLEATGHKSVVLQHETDHLDGVLFLDHLSPLRREIYLKSLKKRQHGAAD